MKINQQLKIKQNQSIVMTPQLQQAIKLLQLTNIELAEYVENAKLENPFIKEDLNIKKMETNEQKTSDVLENTNQNEDPLNDVAFNINLTKSDKVKTAFYSFNEKRSVCDFTANDYGDLKTITKKQKSIVTKGKWIESGENEYENYKLEYVADIDYNSMILYPSHYWHNSYINQDWFIDEDRITLTGFFETIKFEDQK